MTSKNQLHPATTVSNIKSFIPVTLEMESGQYASWSELFKIHCRAFLVHDHLSPRPDPPKPVTSPSDKESQPPKSDDEWDRLDAIVLQWIYGTISNDLLHTILKPNSTAYAAWIAIENIFQDNKSSRAIHLLHKFSNTRLDGFPNVSAYCQELKMLADQLANVNTPVDNDRLVLQLIAGLNEQYEGIATILQQQEPLPSFYTARSKLVQVESRKAEQALHASKTAGTALATGTSQQPQHDNRPDYERSRGRGRGRFKGRGRGRNFAGRGRFSFYNNQGPFWQPPYPPSPWHQTRTAPHAQQAQQFSWPSPPCPYPTTSARSNQAQQSTQGLLGSRPNQAYQAAYTPTDIEQALYTMSLQQPDPTLYMDTGATTTMTNEQGDFHSFFNNCTSQNIVVGNGDSIPVLGQGTKYLPKPFPPFVLKNVLYAPKLLKNLISVRRFTTDNSVSVEFDPFGFLVKDYKTRTPILRCNSSGDLYPLVLGSGSSQPSAFAAISSQLWHQRLGHPGQSPLHSLKNSCSIDFNKSMDNVCRSCVIGKSIRLPFHTSTSCTSQPFDIIHSDLWTSPIVSSGGHRYYILFLDDLTNFLWTFPISKKSQVFSVFSNFAQHIKTQFERTIKTFQCDNGKEYVNASFQNFFDENGMVFRLSCPYTSSQNGKAERKIRTINNMVRTLLAHASLPNIFWHHALETATYLLNILPTKSTKKTTHPPSFCIKALPPLITYVFLGVYATHSPHPLKFINSNIAPILVCFWVTHRIIEDTNVSILKPNKLLSPDM